MSTMPRSLSQGDLAILRRAHQHLEYPSFAARLSSVVGAPIEMTLKLLPKTWYRSFHRYAESAIERALDAAIASLRTTSGNPPSRNVYHKTLGVVSGALGGFFGGPSLLIELPVTTTIMLRTIADIARSEGEDLGSMDSRLACMQVFALGGRSKDDDYADTGYYGIRLALESSVLNASRFIATQGFGANGGSAPALVSLIATISKRFGFVLSEKAAAELVPVVGALGGAFVNGIFIQHFQDMAWSHFSIRRLERKYTPMLIRAEYGKIAELPKLAA
jgi:hypothetical protein